MKEKITLICKNLEKEHNIKIIFAVENGSRAWRMSSKDSDYDVRFVFVRPIQEYLQINKPVEVIQTAFDKYGNKMDAKGSLIDLSGFDIEKFVKMLSDSNPTVIEWLMTDIVYYGKQNEIFKEFASNNFSKISLYHHYKSLSKNNYLKYIKESNDITYKRYLYVFRGLINAKWVAHKKTIPPISFQETIQKSKDFVDQNLIKRLMEIIQIKKSMHHHDLKVVV